MPIYEYRCTNCGHELDALQKVSEPPLTVCPSCNESALVKKISAAGFRLKGGGWYETDFKSGRKRNVAGESSGDTAGASGDGSAGKSGDGAGKDGEGAGKGGGKSGDGGKPGGSAAKSSESAGKSSGSGAKGSSSAPSDGG